MTDVNKDIAIAQTISLMNSYSFDTNGYSAEKLVSQWQEVYQLEWIHLATIEALYQGRYKAVSIEQIMGVWTRMGKPNVHFSGDFQRVISRKLPRHLAEVKAIEIEVPETLKPSEQKSFLDKKISPPFANSKSDRTKPVDPEIEAPEETQGILTFKPLPDASSFFHKLKALAIGESKSN